jgi:hypothetical protein
MEAQSGSPSRISDEEESFMKARVATLLVLTSLILAFVVSAQYRRPPRCLPQQQQRPRSRIRKSAKQSHHCAGQNNIWSMQRMTSVAIAWKQFELPTKPFGSSKFA